MSHGSTDGPGRRALGAPVLSRTTLMTLRRLLHAFRDGWLLEERLAAVARSAADDARRHPFAVEQLVDALDDAWDAMPEVRALAEADARALRARLAALCVRAYHAPGTVPPTARSA